jgi:hypothetical protein
MRFLVVAASLWAGCAGDLPAASFIDKLRVLAVRAEPPEVGPGDASTLDLLVVEPRVPQLDGAAPEPPTAVWLACTIPAGALSVTPCGVGGGLSDGGATLTPPNCAAEPSAPLCVIGTGLTASYTPDAALLGGAASSQILLTVAVADTPAGAIGCLLDIANNDGRPTDPDHCVVSLKRLAVSDPARRAGMANRNPALASFTATSPPGTYTADIVENGSGVWVAAPGEDKAEWTLAANRDVAAAELKPDGHYESLTVSWFTTAGHIDGGRSIYLPEGCTDPAKCATEVPELGADTSWFAPTLEQAAPNVDAATGQIDFWAVIRDDRGGVGWRAGRLLRAP